jgi:hypothetical protein
MAHARGQGRDVAAKRTKQDPSIRARAVEREALIDQGISKLPSSRIGNAPQATSHRWPSGSEK